MDQEGKVANGERGRRLRRWHGYAAAWTVALIVWSVGAAAPDMHSNENLLPSPMFDFSLILTLVLLFTSRAPRGGCRGDGIPQIGAGLRRLGASALRLRVFGGCPRDSGYEDAGDFDFSDGFAFHPFTWLGSFVGMGLGLVQELGVASLIHSAYPRNDGG